MAKVPHGYIIAAIYATVLFLDRLDLTITNITLPTIAQDFHVSITQTEWITNSFLLALAISIPVSSWLEERFGAKKVFISATLLFGISSFLCAVSPSINIMVLFRFLQGIGGGVVIPVGMTMVYREFDHSEYASITSYIFLPTLIAPAIAPAIGGFIIYIANWHWVFLFSPPICLFAVVLSMFVLKKHPEKNVLPLDCPGLIFSSCALISTLMFLATLGKYGFVKETYSLCVGAMIFAFLFVRREQSIPHPLVNLKYFKNKLFVQANLIQLAFQICHFGSIFLVAMYLQVGVGMSALTSGIIMGMQAVGAICTSRPSVWLYHKHGAKLPIVSGFFGVAIFTVCILFFITDQSKVVLGCIILFLRGIFSGLCGTPIQTMSVIGFSKKDIGHVNAIFNITRQISISMGVALSSLLIAYGYHLYGVNTKQAVFQIAFISISMIAMIGIMIASFISKDHSLGKTCLPTE